MAADVILGFKGTALYKYDASDPSLLHLRPNNLLLWQAPMLCREQGYAALDLGRCVRDGEGLRRFKMLWGAEETPLPYYYYPDTRGIMGGGEQGLPYRVLAPALRHMPLFLLQRLGTIASRHVG